MLNNLHKCYQVLPSPRPVDFLYFVEVHIHLNEEKIFSYFGQPAKATRYNG